MYEQKYLLDFETIKTMNTTQNQMNQLNQVANIFYNNQFKIIQFYAYSRTLLC